MPFVGPPISVTSVGPRHWSLNGPLIYQGNKDTFVVPEGFITDFASVPRPLMSLVPPYGKWTRAAILHDWLVTIGIATGVTTSRQADGIFRRVMREEGVGIVLRWLMWTAVRQAALLNPLRRPGWLRDAPLALAISILFLAVVGGVVVGIDRLVHLIL